MWVAAKRRKINVKKAQVDEFVRNRSEKQVTGPPQKAAGKTISEDNNRWMMDLLDTSTITYSGCKFILFCINVFDRVVYARALQSKSEAVVAKALEEILQQAEEKPQVISSDNGSEFVSRKMAEVCARHNIVQKFKDAKDLNALGLMDRNGGLLKKKLMELHTRNSRTWANNLSEAIKVMNATPRVDALHGAAPKDVLAEPEVEFMMLQDQARAIAHNQNITKKRTQALNAAGGTFRAPIRVEKFKKRIFHATYGDPEQAASVAAGRVTTTTGNQYPLKSIKIVPATARRVGTARAQPQRLGG